VKKQVEWALSNDDISDDSEWPKHNKSSRFLRFGSLFRKRCRWSRCYYRPLIEVIYDLSNTANSMILSDFQGRSPRLLQAFRTALQQLTRFHWHSASRDPSAAAELIVKFYGTHHIFAMGEAIISKLADRLLLVSSSVC